MSTKRSKYVFTLYVDVEKVDNKFGIGTATALKNPKIAKNITKISDLESSSKTPEIISFLDESKRVRKCKISMINFKTKQSLVESRYKCYWDKDYIPFNVSPIGCPIKYVASRVIKTYLSEISKDEYSITENVTENKIKEIEDRKDPRFSIENNGYYETDGIFCSFNCVMAFIDNNKHNPLYANSLLLLLKMYQDIFSVKISKHDIMPSPPWRMLKDFGGDLTIEQFRDSFNKVDYTKHGIISSASIGRLFEDKLKF